MSPIDKLMELATSPRASLAMITSLTVFIDTLLRELDESAPEAEELVVAKFRSTLKAVRGQIGQATQSQHVSAAAAMCISACEQFLQKSRRYHTHREAEFLDVIEMLRDATKVMIGGSSDFHARVISASDRMGTFLNLEDVRELKRRISDEVATLRRAAEVKQETDQKIADRLTRRVEALQTSLIKVEREAALDPLTGIANRRSFDRALGKLAAGARASGLTLTLAVIDLDNFKQINDKYGHGVGDRVLLCAADTLVTGGRKNDLVARRGGDEFAVALVAATLDQTVKSFDILVRRIASQEYEYQTAPERRTLRFTISCGVAEMTREDTEMTLIDRADAALYEAKRKGQNRVVGKRA